MARLDKITVLGVKTESTQGSVATLSATDYIVSQDLTIKTNAEKMTRDYTRSAETTTASFIV